MCLIIKNKKITPYKAEKPITVKKLLVRVGKWPFYAYYTPFQGERVKFTMGRCKMGDGSMVTVTRDGMNYAVIDGKPQLRPATRPYLDDLDGNPIVFKGVHAYQESIAPSLVAGLPWGECQCLIKGIIPKGAHYYIGNYGEIVADKMIIHKKFFDKKERK